MNELRTNLTEFYTPRFTWTGRFMDGNMSSIVKANMKNLQEFQKKYGKVNLIHAHVSYPGGHIAMKLSQKTGIPYVITEHMTRLKFEDYVYKKHTKVSSKVSKPLIKANRVIAVSNSLAEDLAVHRSEEGIRIVPNLVDENFFKPSEKSSSNGFITVFCLSNILHSKGIYELLDTIARVKRVNPNVRFRIAGEGRDLKYFKKREQILKIEDVCTWLGPLTREQVKEEMQDCAIHISTSRHETFGLTLVEALACGKPIVCTMCGGPEDIVQENIGVIAETKSSVDIAKKLLYLIDNLEKYPADTIRNNFEERFSSKVVTPQILSVYKELAD